MNVPNVMQYAAYGGAIGYQLGETAVKAGEVLLDKVHDFDGDRSSAADVRRSWHKTKDVVQLSNGATASQKFGAALATAVVAPLALVASPIIHFFAD
jgi:hypothetical protein